MADFEQASEFGEWTESEIASRDRVLGNIASRAADAETELLEKNNDFMLEDLAGAIDTLRTNKNFQTKIAEKYQFFIDSNGQIDGKYVVEIHTVRHAMPIDNFTNYSLFAMGDDASEKIPLIHVNKARNWKSLEANIYDEARAINPDDLSAEQIVPHEGLYKLLTDIQGGGVTSDDKLDLANKLALKHEADNLIKLNIPTETKNTALLPVGADQFIEATSVNDLNNDYTVVHLRLIDIKDFPKDEKDLVGEELVSYRQTYEIDEKTGELIVRTDVDSSSLSGGSPRSNETVLAYIRSLFVQTSVC